MKMRQICILLIIVPIFGLFSSCSSKSGVDPSTTGTQSAPAVAIKDFAFSPASITIKIGSSVTWTNKDVVSHSATEVHNVFDSGGIAPNAAFTYKFTSAGTYTYHCTFHSMMANATVVVTQ